jgi:hypothetical protein
MHALERPRKKSTGSLLQGRIAVLQLAARVVFGAGLSIRAHDEQATQGMHGRMHGGDVCMCVWAGMCMDVYVHACEHVCVRVLLGAKLSIRAHDGRKQRKVDG